MIQHDVRTFNDMKIRPYSLTKAAVANVSMNECEIYVLFGMPEGIGKSSCVSHALADVAGYYNCHDPEKLKWIWEDTATRPEGTEIWDTDWENMKRYILYTPEEVVDLCMSMLDRGERAPMMEWDDAGTWINSMEFNDPFVVSFMKYLNLARTNWGSIILTTPVEEWVLKKLHSAQGVRHVKIIKAEGSKPYNTFKPRTAHGYSIVKFPGRAKSYYNTLFKDLFMAIVPDSFYKWYKPRRDSYARLAVQNMRIALSKRRGKGYMVDLGVDEQALESVEESIAKANDKGPEWREALAQQESVKGR